MITFTWLKVTIQVGSYFISGATNFLTLSQSLFIKKNKTVALLIWFRGHLIIVYEIDSPSQLKFYKNTFYVAKIIFILSLVMNVKKKKRDGKFWSWSFTNLLLVLRVFVLFVYLKGRLLIKTFLNTWQFWKIVTKRFTS